MLQMNIKKEMLTGPVTELICRDIIEIFRLSKLPHIVNLSSRGKFFKSIAVNFNSCQKCSWSRERASEIRLYNEWMLSFNHMDETDCRHCPTKWSLRTQMNSVVSLCISKDRHQMRASKYIEKPLGVSIFAWDDVFGCYGVAYCCCSGTISSGSMSVGCFPLDSYLPWTPW